MDDDVERSLQALHPDAFGWALHCCAGDVELAEDVLQNAYLKIARFGVAWAGRSTLQTWWFGVIRRTAQEEQRRAGRWSLRRLWARRGGGGDDVEVEDPARSSAEQVELDETGERLRGFLRALAPRQAQVLHLVFYQGLSIAQAAEVMGVGVGSARQHYERGKARLRERFRPEESHVR